MPMPDDNINVSGEKKFPHLIMTRLQAGVDWFKCDNCGKEGTCDDLCIINDCTYCPPPCSFCKQTPICAPDCAGIAAIFSSPDIHVCGMIPEQGEVQH